MRRFIDMPHPLPFPEANLKIWLDIYGLVPTLTALINICREKASEGDDWQRTADTLEQLKETL